MDFKGMSDVEIIGLQYSLLEELKQKQTFNTHTVTDNSIEVNPSQNDEKKSELISARVKPSAKQIVENSQYSYSDALEYFAFNVLNNNMGVNLYQSDAANEFINQKFKDENGEFENPKQRLKRIQWFAVGCPTYKDFSHRFGLNYKSIRKIAGRFKWKGILDKALELGWTPIVSKNEFIDVSEKEIERGSKEYNRYHERVLKRDGVCQCCGSKEDLEVHHPMPFNQYNSIGADTNNGITLCKDCHSKYHSEYGYKRNANAVTLALFLRDYGTNPQQNLDAEMRQRQIKGMALPDLLENIKEYCEDNEGLCSITDFVTDCEEFGFTEEKIKEGMDVLIRKGECYYPQKGYIAVIE